MDYDLIILGSSPAGIEAALLAAQYRSRVALLTLDLPIQSRTAIDQKAFFSPAAFHGKRKNLTLDGGFQIRRSRLKLITLPPLNASTRSSILDTSILDTLAIAGIDTIDASGYFLPANRGFYTPKRSFPLTARSYLLALPGIPVIPSIPGLESIPYQIFDSADYGLFQKNDRFATDLQTDFQVSKHWLCLGESLDSLSMAESLIQEGNTVTLLLPKPDFFQERVLQRVQVYLEGLGVKIFTGVNTEQVEQVNNKIHVQTNLGAFQGDRFGLAIEQQPMPIDLHLEHLHPNFKTHFDAEFNLTKPIAVNRFLQSIYDPRLYVCGLSLGGTASETIAIYEACLAVENALYGSKRSVRYDTIAYPRLAHPLYTQLGWTEPQAEQYWLQSHLSILEVSGWEDSTLNSSPNPLINPVLRVILHRNGQILGAQGLGLLAAQAIEVLALGKQQKCSWKTLLKTMTGGAVADLLRGLRWQQAQQERADRKDLWREPFFNWKRTGFF